MMAVESIAGICLDDRVITEFASHPGRLAKIVTMLSDQQIIAVHAWKILINLSKDHRIAEALQAHVPRIIETILDEKSPFCDFACMLLSNVSKVQSSCAAITPFLPKLLVAFLKGREFNPKASYDFLASVFADTANSPGGRAFFLDNNHEQLFALLAQTYSSQVIRRGGSISTIKNCLFDVEQHDSILAKDDAEDLLLAALLAPLACPESVFDQEDLDEMVLDVQLEHRHTPFEPDASLRNLVLESLVLLGTTRHGREVLRNKKIVQRRPVPAH